MHHVFFEVLAMLARQPTLACARKNVKERSVAVVQMVLLITPRVELGRLISFWTER